MATRKPGATADAIRQPRRSPQHAHRFDALRLATWAMPAFTSAVAKQGRTSKEPQLRGKNNQRRIASQFEHTPHNVASVPENRL